MGELHPSHIFLSTALVDTLASYDLIEPPTTTEQVSLQIQALLAGPASAEANQAAHGIVSNQLEDIFSEAHSAAIESLEPEQRVKLLTMAALGSTYGVFDDWILRQLIDAKDPGARPAFIHWATQLNADTPFPQEVPARYILSMEGIAQFEEEPPKLIHCETKDEMAWQCYGEIVFWLHRPGVTLTQIKQRCAPAWQRLKTDLLTAAADPLYQIAHASMTTPDGVEAHQLIFRNFPEELREILELSLARRSELTSIFRFRMEAELTIFIINTLGYVGSRKTVELLAQFADDPVLGPTAISSIRRLNDGRDRRSS
jgi:hypothetical protein